MRKKDLVKLVLSQKKQIDKIRNDFYTIDDWVYNDCICFDIKDNWILKEDAIKYRRMMDSNHHHYTYLPCIRTLTTKKGTYKYNKPQIDEWEKECKAFEKEERNRQKQDG